MRKGRFLLLVTAMFLVAGTAFGGYVFLKSGETLLGEIVDYVDGEIILITENGEVRVPWDEVAQLDQREFERIRLLAILYEPRLIVRPDSVDTAWINTEMQAALGPRLAVHLSFWTESELSGSYPLFPGADDFVTSTIIVAVCFRPWGEYLKGFYVGPRIGFIQTESPSSPDDPERDVAFGAGLGYEWIGSKGLALSIAAGVNHNLQSDTTAFEATLGIGYALNMLTMVRDPE